MYSAVTPTAGNAPPNATYWTALPNAALPPTGDNLLPSPVALDRVSVSGGALVETLTSGSDPHDFKRIKFPGGAGFCYPEADWTTMKVVPGDTVFFQHTVFFTAATSVAVNLQMFDGAGTYVSSTSMNMTLAGAGGTGAWRRSAVGSVVIPAGIGMVRPEVQAIGSAGDSYAADFFFGRQQQGTQKLDLSSGLLVPVFSANLGYKFTGSITYSATSTSATISVGAGNLVMGSTTIAYSAMSATVSGTASTSVDFQLYVQEASATNSATWGGSKTLVATSTSINVLNDDRNVRIGGVTGRVSRPAAPAAGRGGGGSGGGGGPIP